MDDSGWNGVTPVNFGGLDNLASAYMRALASARAPQSDTTVMAKSNPYVPGPADGGGWDSGPFPGGYALNHGKMFPSHGGVLSDSQLTPPQPAALAAPPPPLPLGDMLSAAAMQEGERYRQRKLAAGEPDYTAANTTVMAKSDPWKAIQSSSDQRNAPLRAPLGEAPMMPAAAGQPEGGWLSLTGVPPAPQPAQPTDYQGMALNSGNNLSNQSFVDLYNRSMAARGREIPVDPLRETPAVRYPDNYMAPPDASPMEKWNRGKNASDFLRDAALSFHPATAGMYAGWNAADLAGNAAQHAASGNYGNAAMSAAGAALNAAGMFPGGGAAGRYAQEAAAAGHARPKIGPDGQIVTQATEEPGGYMAHQAVMETPGQQLNIFLGANAKTADLGALQAANEMRAAGSKPEEILAKTGWFWGADGKPRFEVSDQEAQFGGVRRRGDTTYATSFEHPGYAAAYGGSPGQPGQPQFGAMWSRGLEPGGSYLSQRGVEGEPGYTAPRMAVTAGTQDLARGVSLHEMQHDIQRKEGFAPGGRPDTRNNLEHRVFNTPEDAQEFIKNLLPYQRSTAFISDVSTGRSNAPAQKAVVYKPYGEAAPYDIYLRLAGEVEANNVRFRRNMTPEQRIETPPWKTQSVPNNQQIIMGDNGGVQRMLPAVPFGKATYPQYVQAALGDKEALSSAASPGEFKDHLQALSQNRAVDPDTRHYLQEVHNYAFRPAGTGDYSNNIMQAYMNKTGGQMGRPVPINDLYQEYLNSVKQRDAAGLRKTGGAEFYTKDINAFNKHLHLFGRRVGENFDQVPTKPAPWLIDPQAGTVAFSPYVPESPMIRALGGK
jgi:Large polyvalent protein associated domain 23